MTSPNSWLEVLEHARTHVKGYGVESAMCSMVLSIDAALLKICIDNAPDMVGEPDSDIGRYVLLNENGDPMIDTSDPVEVISQLDKLWAGCSELLEKQTEDLLELRKAEHVK